MTTQNPHRALDVPLSERVDYLTILASMAGADVVIAEEELKILRALCEELELPEREAAEVLQTAHRPTDQVERHLDALKGSPLRFSLLSDCLSLAYADGDYAASERTEVRALAQALEVTDAQLAALEECVVALRAADPNAGVHHRAEELSSKLAAVGIPIGMLATASAVGLTTAGVSSGAAALALGFGIATGFGAILGLSLGTIVGVRWLHARLRGAT